MTYDFRYLCTRRPARQHPAREEASVKGLEMFGAGSGGGGEIYVDKYGNKSVSAEKGLSLNGAAVFIDGTGDSTASPAVSIMAGETGTLNGRISAHGSQGVRITSGPPQQPPAENPGINGIELYAGEGQVIKIERGWGLYNDIQLKPSGITVDGVQTPVSISSISSIVLEVASGLSSITLSPQGITIKGLITYIN